MKNLKFLSMLLFIITCSFMVSCSKDDDSDDTLTSIIGEWTQVNNAGTLITVKFNSNKTGNINFTYADGSGDSNENFEYDYIKDERKLTIIGSSLNGQYTVTLTNTVLLLSDMYEGYSYKFTKK